MNAHTFHIPVMGIGYTIDTPIKVAQYGISSVVSLIDDELIEKMREFHSHRLNIPFSTIDVKTEDYRAKRITAYLNLMDIVVKEKFARLKETVFTRNSEFDKYMEMLPDSSSTKQKINEVLLTKSDTEITDWIEANLQPGSIDVNIMTKLDRENFRKNEKLPVEYNDAHSALRGFANSTLNSSVVLSAGMNPRLYSYFEQLEDFFPDGNMNLSKKIILKVSDFRSALIQGKFLTKKGLWISEFRIESGLNCGGHAFATQGHLMGPILEEFKNQRDYLISTLHEIYSKALKEKNRNVPEVPLNIKITAQGGVGTNEEHQFLLEYYQLDSIGWGTPFLLVPSVVNVDNHTGKLLSNALEEDLYLSDISPLGVQFNNLRNNTKDVEKQVLIENGTPGSICTKRFVCFNTELTEKPVCASSRRFQSLKLKELEDKKITDKEYKREYAKIVDKSCVCVGLGMSVLLANKMDTGYEGEGVSVCPGPNMAYFSETVNLPKMVDHIYGRINLVHRNDRPNMFIKELSIYIDYLRKKTEQISYPVEPKQMEYLDIFHKNLTEGVEYYKKLFTSLKHKFEDVKSDILNELQILEANLLSLKPIEIYSK
jgi:hypothetical protein